MTTSAALPFCNMDTFIQQLEGKATPTAPINSTTKPVLLQAKKDVVLAFVSDQSGCGHIRCIFPMLYLNSTKLSREGTVKPIILPRYVYQNDMMVAARSLFFQRAMSPDHLPHINRYKHAQQRFGYKMVYDIDDWIFKVPADSKYEGLPKYNPASEAVGQDHATTALEIMNMMDHVTVSSEYLKKHLTEVERIKPPVTVVNNAIPMFFWDSKPRRAPITKRIEKPRVIYTGSPTHYCNVRKLKGDWENAWYEWVVKSVRGGEIEFIVMGGLPWFFESIKDKIRVVGWLNSFQYHLPLMKFAPHFGLAPLVPNHFNFSKSFIKHTEYCAAGAVSIGTVFTSIGMPSPYEVNVVKAPHDITVKQIDALMDELREPEAYNKTVAEQYKQLDTKGWWLESPDFVNLLGSVL